MGLLQTGFTLPFVLNLGSWPPQGPAPALLQRRVIRNDPEVAALMTVAHADGSLECCLVKHDGTAAVQGRSVPLAIDKPGNIIVMARWAPGEERVLISVNGRDFGAHGSGPAIALATGAVADPTPSWEDRRADAACAIWIERRTTRFISTQTPVERGRRPKTRDEQIAELATSLDGLNAVLEIAKQGNTSVIGYLAATLRALVYTGLTFEPFRWPANRNYSALLLRVAAHVRAPLPIYVHPDEALVPEGVPTPDFLLALDSARTTRYSDAWVLTDLQEWLVRPIIYLAPPTGGEAMLLTPERLIASVANTRGAAHFDETAPVVLDPLLDLSLVNGAGAIDQSLVTCATLIVELGEFVLTKAAQVEERS